MTGDTGPDRPPGPRHSVLPGEASKDQISSQGQPLPSDTNDRAGAQPRSEEKALRVGSLADHLQRTNRHPVIVFGTGASGKSTLLMSLVQALNRSNEVNIYLGEPIFPEGHPEADEAHEQAIQFFERDAQQFALGEPVPPTRFEKPYFVPVDVQKKSDGRIVRLALLESRGEWYAPIKGGTGSMFPRLKEDIAEIIELYGESLSVLWVAPYSVGGGKGKDTQDSDLALMGAVNEYRKLRLSIGQDYHLFLLTMWDCEAEPLADDPSFSIVSARRVEKIISDRYPNAWPNYQGLALKATGRRFFMQYSSGHIVGDRVRVPPQRHRGAFDRYPRTVWNWLYGNATLTQLDAEGRRFRSVLFADVMPQPRRPVPLMRRVAQVVLAR